MEPTTRSCFNTSGTVCVLIQTRIRYFFIPLLFLHSEELQDALGVTDKSLPPFIYRMRQLGYPPGWLKEAELEGSGLALYDGKGIVCEVR